MEGETKIAKNMIRFGRIKGLYTIPFFEGFVSFMREYDNIMIRYADEQKTLGVNTFLHIPDHYSSFVLGELDDLRKRHAEALKVREEQVLSILN